MLRVAGMRRVLGIAALALGAAACAADRPVTTVPEGVSDGVLRPCSVSPNCVSSEATDEAQWIAPIELIVPAEEAWAEAVATVAALPRTTIVVRSDRFIHAECRGSLLGFVDDLELVLRAEHMQIAIRSSSRMGYGDLGANRKRVETIRSLLVNRGVAGL